MGVGCATPAPALCCFRRSCRIQQECSHPFEAGFYLPGRVNHSARCCERTATQISSHQHVVEIPNAHHVSLMTSNCRWGEGNNHTAFVHVSWLSFPGTNVQGSSASFCRGCNPLYPGRAPSTNNGGRPLACRVPHSPLVLFCRVEWWWRGIDGRHSYSAVKSPCTCTPTCCISAGAVLYLRLSWTSAESQPHATDYSSESNSIFRKLEYFFCNRPKRARHAVWLQGVGS